MAYESTAPPLSYLTGRAYLTTINTKCQQKLNLAKKIMACLFMLHHVTRQMARRLAGPWQLLTENLK